MIGAKPRGPGMERADLLNQNGEIFQVQVRQSVQGVSPCEIVLKFALKAGDNLWVWLIG